MLKRFKSWFIRLLYSLHYQTDPAVSLAPNFIPRSNNEFLVPLMLLLLNITYGTIGLQYQYESLINISQLSNCRFVYTHQTLPHRAWKPFDFIMIIDHITVIGLFLTIILNPNINSRYIFFPINDGTRFVVDNCKLTRQQSKIIIKYRKLKLPMYIFVNSFFILASIYFYITLFSNNIPIKTISYIYWFVIFPLGLWSLIYGKIISKFIKIKIINFS